MSLQLILRIAGVAALVVAALFAVLAVHYYLSQNIRGVMDDLSGKARARGVAGARRSTASAAADGGARRPAKADASGAPASVRKATVDEAPAAMPAFAFETEDDAGTMLVAPTSLQASAPSEDDLATMVDAGDTGRAPASRDEDDLATVVAGADESQTSPAADPAVFRVTRSIVYLHSDEVVRSREELIP